MEEEEKRDCESCGEENCMSEQGVVWFCEDCEYWYYSSS